MAEGGTTIVDGDPVPNESPTCQPGGSELDFLETVEGRKLAYKKVDGTSPGVVFIHGFGSNMNGQKALALEEYCRGRGTAYVRFDLSGHGQSSEEFTECNVTMWLEDLNSVLQLLTEGPQVLVGSSLGGWLMFLYTMRNPDKICGLIGISAAADYIDHIWKGLDKETKQQVRKSGVYRLPSRYSSEPITITLQLIQDADKYCILNMPGIEFIKVPTWLFHSQQDDVVPSSVSLALMQKLQCPVSLKTVADGDHQLSRPQDIAMILEALSELLSPGDASSKSADPDPDD